MRVLINLQIQSQLPHRHAQPYTHTHTRKPAWIHNTHYTCTLRKPTQTHWQAHTSELSVGWFQFQSDFTAWPRTRPLADGTLPCMSSGNWELKVMFSVMIHNIMIFLKSSACPLSSGPTPPGYWCFPRLMRGFMARICFSWCPQFWSYQREISQFHLNGLLWSLWSFTRYSIHFRA